MPETPAHVIQRADTRGGEDCLIFVTGPTRRAQFEERTVITETIEGVARSSGYATTFNADHRFGGAHEFDQVG